LELGVFGGKYMMDCTTEFPASWFRRAKLCHERHDPKLNFFGVNASQPLSVWQARGWIHEDDPRGWFQWYCRYYLGRRHEDDDRPLAGNPPARCPGKEELSARRPPMSSAAATSITALGVRFAKNLACFVERGGFTNWSSAGRRNMTVACETTCIAAHAGEDIA